MCWAKMVQPIEMPFGGLTHEGQRNHVLDGDLDPHGKRYFMGDGCRDGDEALC